MLSAKYRQLVVVILEISKYGSAPSHFLPATAPTPQPSQGAVEQCDILKQTRER